MEDEFKNPKIIKTKGFWGSKQIVAYRYTSKKKIHSKDIFNFVNRKARELAKKYKDVHVCINTKYENFENEKSGGWVLITPDVIIPLHQEYEEGEGGRIQWFSVLLTL